MDYSNLKKALLLLGIFLMGITYIVLIPPLQIPDEPAHFARALQLSRGEFFPKKIGNQTGGYFSKSIRNQLQLFGEVPFHGEKKVSRTTLLYLWHDLPAMNIEAQSEFIEFSNMSLYSPIVYLPDILAIELGQMGNFNFISTLYLARMFSWIFAFSLLVYSFSLVAFHKKTQIFLGLGFLTPMALSQFASTSADCSSFIFAALCISLTIRAWHVGLEKYFWPKVLFLALCLSFSKLVFFSIALLPLLLIFQYPNKKNYLYAGLLCLFATLPTVLWSILIKPYFSPIRPGVDPDAQLLYVSQNPFAFFSLIKIHLSQQWKELFSTYTGRLGWLDTPIRFSFEYALLLCLGSLLQPSSEQKLSFSLPARLWSVICAALFFLCTYFSIYLSFNPVGQSFMEGMVGRYLIPVFVLFLLFLPTVPLPKFRQIPIIYYSILGVSFLFIHAKAFSALWNRFWIP